MRRASPNLDDAARGMQPFDPLGHGKPRGDTRRQRGFRRADAVKFRDYAIDLVKRNDDHPISIADNHVSSVYGAAR
jgi:hypothetical protein